MRRAAWLCVYVGNAAVVFGLAKAHAKWIGFYDFTGTSRFTWSAAYVVLLCLATYGVGLPDQASGWRSAGLALVATLAAALGVSAIQLGVGSALLPRFVVFWTIPMLIAWNTACSTLIRRSRGRAEERVRVLAVVTADEAETLSDDLASAPERPASLVGVLSVDAIRGERPEDGPLVIEAIALAASVVVLDRHALEDESIVAQAALLHEGGRRVRTLSAFYDEWLGKLPLAELERVSLMFDIGEVHRSAYLRLKRLVDVIVAAMGLVALVVVLPLVLVGNRVANRGQAFFRQARVGKGGAEFQILKFRTMEPGSESMEWTLEGDSRITPFGRWLRRTHIDELPQVINILKGDLSTVGPRPEQPGYVRDLTGKIPFYSLRHLVRPGLTGWAQVNYAYGSSAFDALEKLQFEFYYLRHQSLALDLKILGRTLRSVIRARGR